jgi:GNAT superfamily N-acetyltransferase
VSAPAGSVVYRCRREGGLAEARAFVDRVASEEHDPVARDYVRGAAGAATLDGERDILLTAERDGALVGVLYVTSDAAHPDAGRVQWLMVAGPERNAGVGRELLERGIEACRERRMRVLRAWSFAASPAGPHLFWLSGFRVVDLVPVTIGDGMRESILFEKRHGPP